MAEAAFTIGSIGDIISLCRVLHGAVKLLNDSRRSAAHYQNLGKEILNLSRTLVAVRLLLEQEPELQRKGDIEKAVADCHDCFVRFLDRIQAFECLGGDRNSRPSVRVLYKRLQWPKYSVSVQKTFLLCAAVDNCVRNFARPFERRLLLI